MGVGVAIVVVVVEVMSMSYIYLLRTNKAMMIGTVERTYV